MPWVTRTITAQVQVWIDDEPSADAYAETYEDVY